MIKVLFVCLGNICRSPMAQIILQNMVNDLGLENNFEIESAATEGYNEMCHAGIHRGTKEILRRKGIFFEEHYSKKIRKSDYEYYDYILAMDNLNLRNIKKIIPRDPENKIYTLLTFAGISRDIADPWYTGNFDKTYDDIVMGIDAFLKYLEKNNLI